MYFFSPLAGWLLRMFCRQQIIEIINPTRIYLIDWKSRLANKAFKFLKTGQKAPQWKRLIYILHGCLCAEVTGWQWCLNPADFRDYSNKDLWDEKRKENKIKICSFGFDFFIKSSIFQVGFWTWSDALGDPIQGPALKISESFTAFAFIRFLFLHFFLAAEVKNLFTS